MSRLFDYGLGSLSNLIMKMSDLSMRSVDTAIELYKKGDEDESQLFEWSKELSVLQDEVTELAVELIYRYQPVATDLRFIRSCMEISYGFPGLAAMPTTS
jgi:phosphate transport system protein